MGFWVAIVEAVRDGTTLRVRLLMPDGEHQFVNVTLAGVRSARAASKQGEPSEPWGEEVGHTRPPPPERCRAFSLIQPLPSLPPCAG